MSGAGANGDRPQSGDRPRVSLLDRSPVWILQVFIVGLALHNIAMAELYDAGIRGTALDAVSAWKELLLVLGIALELRQGTLRRRLDRIDLLAAAYAAFVVLYGVIPRAGSMAARRTTGRSLPCATTCCRCSLTRSGGASA